jgi:NitT/TauT family transport system permease protein
MSKTLINKLIQKILYPFVISAVIILVWQWITDAFSIESTVLPNPINIWKAMTKNFNAQIFPDLVFTLKIIILGYLIAIFLGFGLAALCAQSRFLVRAVSPIAVIFLLTPMVILIPVFMVFLGFTPIVRILVVVLQTSPIILLNTLSGFTSITREQNEFLTAHGCTKSQIFFKHTLFSSIPQIFTGLKIGTIIATTAAIGADFTMGKIGLGYRIKISSAMVRVDMVFASIFVSALLGIVMFEIVSFMEQKVIVWKKN